MLESEGIEYLFLSIILACNLVILFREIRKVTFLLKKGIRATGQIISIKEDPDSEAGPNPLELKIRFQDFSGQEFVFKETVPYDVTINSPIIVLYNSKNPESAIIYKDDISVYRNIIFWSITGLIQIIVLGNKLFF